MDSPAKTPARTWVLIVAGALFLVAVPILILVSVLSPDRRDRSDFPGIAQLFVIGEDGSGIRQLSQPRDLSAEAGQSVWSSDSRWIGVPSNRGRPLRSAAVWITRPDGGQAHRVSLPSIAADLRWLKGDKRLQFVMRVLPGPTRESWIGSVGIGGGAVRQVPLGVKVREASWSPDGSRLVFSVKSDSDDESRLWFVDRDGQGLGASDPLPGRVIRPAYSPDGSRIAFVLSGKKRQSVWSVAPDGTHPTRLSRDLEEVFLSWAPSGDRLAVTGIEPSADLGEKYFHLFVLPASGGELVETNGAPISPYAEWSPDGELIAVVTASGDFGSVDDAIMLVRADGGERREIVTGDSERGFIDDLAWSPDGSRLSFSGRGGDGGGYGGSGGGAD